MNHRFGEDLGFIGTEPRFAWGWAPDLYRYTRKSMTDSITRICWAERLGQCWVLTELAPPKAMVGDRVVQITEQDWWASFHGQIPYPRLASTVYTETALIPGLEPDARMTAFYIAGITEQLTGSLHERIQASEADAQADQDEERRQFMEMADDWFPAFWSSKGGAHLPGTRGGHVSFGDGT